MQMAERGHSLVKPRSRRPDKMQRKPGEKTWRLDITRETYKRWTRIGVENNLTSHSAIAALLIDSYDHHQKGSDSDEFCPCCHGHLRLVCDACGTASESRQTKGGDTCHSMAHPEEMSSIKTGHVPASASEEEAMLSSLPLTSAKSLSAFPLLQDGGQDDVNFSQPSSDEHVDVSSDTKHSNVFVTRQMPFNKINNALSCGSQGDAPDHNSRRDISFQPVQSVEHQMPTRANERHDTTTHSSMRLSGERPYQCVLCSVAFTRNSYLTVHMRNNHTGLKPHKCQYCDVAYADARNLKVHLRKHTGDRPFLCQDCGKSFADQCVLARHRRQHTGLKPYRCAECDMSFTNSGSLKYHARRHLGLRPYLCHECGVAFTSSSQLSQHRRTHTGLKPFSCPECPAAFARSHNLKSHMLKHSGQKPARRLKKCTCPHCGAVFTDNRNFVRHVRIHTGDKPYQCDQCVSAFAQPGDLKKHARIHSGQKPYTCSVCGSRFRHSSGLTIHFRTHTGQKPYQCSHCQAAFVSSSKLTVHIRSRHKPTVVGP